MCRGGQTRWSRVWKPSLRRICLSFPPVGKVLSWTRLPSSYSQHLDHLSLLRCFWENLYFIHASAALSSSEPILSSSTLFQDRSSPACLLYSKTTGCIYLFLSASFNLGIFFINHSIPYSAVSSNQNKQNNKDLTVLVLHLTCSPSTVIL